MSFSPFDETPKKPEEQLFSPEFLQPGLINEFAQLERKTLLASVLQKIGRITPLLIQNNGICFYKAPMADHETKIFVTNRQEFTDSPTATAVCINTTRSPDPDEPNFPSGRVLELMDICVDKKHSLINHSVEVLDRPVGQTGWQTPERTTLLVPGHDTIKLLGNLAHRSFPPRRPASAQNAAEDCNALWDLYLDLDYCTPGLHEEHIAKVQRHK